MFRISLAVVIAISLAACGGSDKKSSTPPPSTPHLTFNGTTTVDAGSSGTVSIPSNTEFTIEAPGAIGWNYAWSPDDVPATAYSSGIGGSSYTARVAAEEPIQYVVTVTFSGDETATLRINITSGGTCEAVTCSDHGTCGSNDADFPVCSCDLPYYADGFDCSFAGSCQADDGCVDYIGAIWDLSDGCAEDYTLSAEPCVTPAAVTLLGSCNAASPQNPAARYIARYYSPPFTLESAQDTCDILTDSQWIPE